MDILKLIFNLFFEGLSDRQSTVKQSFETISFIGTPHVFLRVFFNGQ